MGGRPARKLSHSVSVGVSFSVRDIYLINPGRLASLKGSAALDSTSYILRDDWRTTKKTSTFRWGSSFALAGTGGWGRAVRCT